MVRGASGALAVVVLAFASPAMAQVPGSFEAARELARQSDPVVREARWRLEAQKENEAQARKRGYLELRGSYFYYPNSNVGEEDLTETRQRADLYLRYPLLERFVEKPREQAQRQSEVAHAEAVLRDAEAACDRHLLFLYLDLTEATALGAVQRSERQRWDAEVERLRHLWEDKVVLLEDLLEAQARSDKAALEEARLRSRAEDALAKIQVLVGDETWEATPLPLEPVILSEKTSPQWVGTAGEPELLRSQNEGLRAEQRDRGLSLDLEGGYIWEEDESDGLQGGPRVGVRFRMPLTTGESWRRQAAQHRAEQQVWLARAQAAVQRERLACEGLAREAEQVLLEDRVLSVEKRLDEERSRVEELRGGRQRETRTADAQRRRWELYFRARRLHVTLSACGAQEGPGQGHTFLPPPSTIEQLRKSPPRGAYVWGGPGALGPADGAIDFARAKGVVELLVSAGREPLASSEAGWASLLEYAEAAGLRVSLLLGENSWVEPARRGGLWARLDEFRGFQAQTGGALAGVHLDVEPHALPHWDEAQDRLLEEWVQLVEEVRQRLDAVPGAPRLVCSVPWWLPGRWTREQAARIADSVQGLALMAYGPADVGRLAQTLENVTQGEGHVDVAVALRASDWPNEGEMERAIRELLQASPSVGVVLVQDWTDWLTLSGSIQEGDL